MWVHLLVSLPLAVLRRRGVDLSCCALPTRLLGCVDVPDSVSWQIHRSSGLGNLHGRSQRRTARHSHLMQPLGLGRFACLDCEGVLLAIAFGISTSIARWLAEKQHHPFRPLDYRRPGKSGSRALGVRPAVLDGMNYRATNRTIQATRGHSVVVGRGKWKDFVCR